MGYKMITAKDPSHDGQMDKVSFVISFEKYDNGLFCVTLIKNEDNENEIIYNPDFKKKDEAIKEFYKLQKEYFGKIVEKVPDNVDDTE